MKKLLSAVALAALVAAFSAPALAGTCPNMVKKIDAALAANPDVSAEQTTQITKLRNEGEAQHKAGSHGDAVDSLNKALEILGIM